MAFESKTNCSLNHFSFNQLPRNRVAWGYINSYTKIQLYLKKYYKLQTDHIKQKPKRIKHLKTIHIIKHIDYLHKINHRYIQIGPVSPQRAQ